MFCKFCGMELDERDPACLYCGAPREPQPEKKEPAYDAPEYIPPAPPAPPAQQTPPAQQYYVPQTPPAQQYYAPQTPPAQQYYAPQTPPTQQYYAQQPVYVVQPKKKRVNVLGIIAFVVSLLSLWLGTYFCIVPIVGLVLSAVGVGLRGRYTSCNGLAIAGLVISIVSLVFWGIIWIIGSLFLSAIIGIFGGFAAI